MTVQLRSMKVTRSLINQLCSPVLESERYDDFESIGWIFLKDKYALVLDKHKNTLHKMRPIILTGKSDNGRVVHYNSRAGTGQIRFPNLLQAERWETTMRRLMAESLEKGQIFI